MHGLLDENGKWIENLTADSANWEHQWRRKGSQPGWGIKQTAQFLIAKSSDNGLTWSEPENLTSMIKKPEWWLLAPAPGHGITMKDGTLVLPTEGRDAKGEPFSNITWSKDHGKTWTTSNPAYNNVTECNVVELNDGSLMLNMRDNRNRGNTEVNGRRICTTSDLGTTWTEHPTSRKTLIEPTCMASLHKHEYTDAQGNKTNLLLFANPSSHSIRDSLTLKVSFDNGQTWLQKHWILFDQFRSAGYSSIASVDDNTIGILYESSLSDLVYLQFKLSEIVRE
jgi:sialidase-1